MLSAVLRVTMDYAVVRVRVGGSKPLFGFTPFATLNSGEDLYHRDYFQHTDDLDTQGFFAHEAMYTLQTQSRLK